MIFSSTDEKEIIEAIKKAEKMTSGEIRIHLDNHLKGDALAKAQHIFYKLNMDKTQNKNGVLLYIAVKDKKIAIIGDENIHKMVNQNFWNEIIKEISLSFKQGNYKNGIILAIEKIGKKLKIHFPHQTNDKNELPDELSRS